MATRLTASYNDACDIAAPKQEWPSENDQNERRVSQFFATLATSVIAPYYARLAGLDTIAAQCESGVDIETVLQHPDLAVEAYVLDDNEVDVLTSTPAYAQACGALALSATADAIATGRSKGLPHNWAAGYFCGHAIMQGYYHDAPSLPTGHSVWVSQVVLYAIREAQIIDRRCYLSPVVA